MFYGTINKKNDKSKNFKVLLLTQKLWKSVEISKIDALNPFKWFVKILSGFEQFSKF